MFASTGAGGAVKSILAVAVISPFYLIGFDVIPQAAEEINVSTKKIGRMLILPEWGMVAAWSLLGGVFFAVYKSRYKESFGSMVQLISDEDAATLLPEADERELDKVIDGAIDRVLARLA